MRARSSRSQRPLAIVGGVLVLVIAELAARLVMSYTTDAIRWYDAVAQRKVEQMESTTPVEMVFAGTSMAQQAFIPAVLTEGSDRSAWNAGLAGGTPEVMAPWLLDEVVPRLQPSTVVWGLSSFDVAPAYGPAQAEVYGEALATRTGWLADVERAVASRSVLVRNRSVLRSFDAIAGTDAHDRQAAHDEAARITGPGGERTDDTADVSDQRRRIVEARLTGFVPDAADLALIEQTAAELQRRGIEVVLVELPVPQRFRDAHPRGDADHAQVGPALAGVAERLDLRFLRLTDTSAIDFIDFTHLDRESAVRFSERVSDALSSGRDDTAATLAEAPSSTDPPSPIPLDDGAPSANCEPEIVRDEYGFAIDLANCDRAAETITPERLLESLTEPDVHDAATDALAQLRRVSGSACEQPETWSQRTTNATESTLEFAAALRESESAWIGSGDARSFADVIRQLLVMQVGCRTGFVDATVPVEGVAARAAAANDAAFSALSGTTTQNIVSEFWYHRWELGHSRQLAQLVDNSTDVDILFVGASVGKHGVNPHTVAETFSSSVYNASVPGQSSEMLGLWWSTLDELGVKPSIVVVARSPFEGFLPCNTERLDAAIRARDLRRDAFGPIAALHDADEHRLMSRSATEMIERFSLQVDDRGWFSSARSRDDRGKARQLENLGEVFAESKGCGDRDGRVTEVFADLQGIHAERVLVVDFPLNPELTALHPDGRPAFDQHQAVFVESLPPDMPYLDLRDLLAREEFLDLTHANLDGQVRITEALIEFIAAETSLQPR